MFLPSKFELLIDEECSLKKKYLLRFPSSSCLKNVRVNRHISSRIKRRRRFLRFDFDSNYHRRDCPLVDCDKDFISAAPLSDECCGNRVPWKNARSASLHPPPSPQQQAIAEQQHQGPFPFNSYSTGEQRVDGEIASPFYQYARPRWTRVSDQVSLSVFSPSTTCLSLSFAVVVRSEECSLNWKSEISSFARPSREFIRYRKMRMEC